LTCRELAAKVELPGGMSLELSLGSPHPGANRSKHACPKPPNAVHLVGAFGRMVACMVVGSGGLCMLGVVPTHQGRSTCRILAVSLPGRILVASLAQAGASLSLSLFILFACLVGPLGAGRVVGRVGVNHNHDLAALELAPLELAPLGAGPLGAGPLGAGLGVLLFGLQLFLPCERSIRSWPGSGN
jgi:hypothetical protein